MTDRVIFAPSLLDAFEQIGIPYPGREPEPGRLLRFPTNGRRDDLAGWLRVFHDQDGAAFGCWRSGESYVWQREREGPPPDPAELARIRKRADEARHAAEAEREAGYREAARKAAATWNASETATEHPYLAAKGIGPHIARERGGWLVIPVFDGEGTIQSVQSVSPTGEKRFLPGGRMAGGRCWIGEPDDAGPILIAEGYATACTLHEATGWPVCAAFNAGNLGRVAADIRRQYPLARIVVCGDDDRATEGNPGRTKATEAARAIRADVVFPIFDGPDGSDFNDLHAQAGLEAVHQQIRAALAPTSDEKRTTAADVIEFESPALQVADARDGTERTRPLTELGNALRLLDQHGDRLRYVPEVGAWLVWRDAWHWDTDGADVRAAAAALPGAIYGEGASFKADEAVHFAKWARTSQSARAINATVNILADQRAVRVPLAAIDADDMLVGLDQARKVIDLRTGAVRSATPADFVTRSLHVTEVGDARRASRWREFLQQVFDGDAELIDWLHRVCGYLLTGSTAEQFFVFCFGLGANGKSIFAETLRYISGDYARSIPAETLCESKRQAGSASPDLADLIGCRLATSSETEDGQHLAESLVKSLTAGDTISARPLYGKPLQFRPAFKLLMLGNHRPVIRGNDYGIWRRVRLVPFNRTFGPDERDPHLLDKLKVEAPHILGWMIDGCAEWQRRGLTDVPKAVADQTAEYRQEQDVIGQWLAECTFRDPTSETSSTALYQSYRDWAIASGLKPTSNVALGRRLGERGFVKKPRNGKNWWHSIALVSAETNAYARAKGDF